MLQFSNMNGEKQNGTMCFAHPHKRVLRIFEVTYNPCGKRYASTVVAKLNHTSHKWLDEEPNMTKQASPENIEVKNCALTSSLSSRESWFML